MEVLGILLVILIILVIGGAVVAGRSLKVVQQYEQALIFRFGKVLPGTRGPGLTVIRPIGDRLQKVNMQIVAMAVPAQDGITRDNVTVRVDAVVYFRVVDPIKATVNVQNYLFAVSQQAQTSLRSIIGQSEMDQLLSERDSVNRELRRIIDEPTEGPWGIRVERVEIKDVSLPESMKRSMSRQAEAERERRARIITADGEYQASKRLAAAANVMARDPAALQLRLLQTVVEVAGEKNSTLVMPVPVELLRFFDKMTPQVPAGEPKSAADSASLADFGNEDVASRRGGNRKRSAARDTRGPAGARARRARGACPPRGGGSGGDCQLRSRRPPRTAPVAVQPGRSRIPNDPPAGSPAPGASPACWRALGRRRDHALGWRHDEVGVRDGAAARARDQADP